MQAKNSNQAVVWVHPVLQQCSATAASSPSELHGKTILLVLCGAPGRWRLLHSLRSAGLTLVCYSSKPDPGWAEAYIPRSHWVHGPLDDHTTAINSVQQWQSEHHTTLDGVLCYDEYGVELAAVLGQAFHLPYAIPELARDLRCKYKFRQRCLEEGIMVPHFVRLTQALDPLDELPGGVWQGLRFPVVAKPTCCAGSFAVTRCDCMSDLVAAAERFFEQLPRYLTSIGIDPESEAAARWGMVVEEMVEGDEVDIDCVVVRGQLVFAAISDNHPQPPTTDCCAFMERGCRCPSVLPQQEQTALLQLAQSVASLWGDSLGGVIHLEAFSTPQGPVPIELNARIGGAETYTNILSVWGVDLAVQAARIALGLLPHINITTSHAATASAQPLDNMAQTLVARHVEEMPGQSCAMSITACKPQALAMPDSLCVCSCSPPCPCCLTSACQSPCSCGSSCLCSSCTSRSSLDELRCTVPDTPAHSDAAGSPPNTDQCCSGAHHQPTVRQGSYSLPPQHAHHSHASSGSDVSCGDIGVFAGWCDVALQLDDSQAGAGTQHNSKQQPASDNSQQLTGSWGMGHATPAQPPAQQSAATGGADANCVLHQPMSDCVVLARPQCHVYSVNFVPEWRGEGVVEVLRVEEGVRRDPDCVDAELYFGPGALVKLPPAGYSALGWMVARGHSSHNAETAMTRLMEGVHIQLQPPPAAEQPKGNQ